MIFFFYCRTNANNYMQELKMLLQPDKIEKLKNECITEHMVRDLENGGEKIAIFMIDCGCY